MSINLFRLIINSTNKIIKNSWFERKTLEGLSLTAEIIYYAIEIKESLCE